MPTEEITAPRSLAEFQERLRRVSRSLPKRLKQCAEYVASNPDKIAFSTVADIAADAQVPASAMMRFCQEMGFSGYSQMQKLYREEYSQKWPDYSTRLSSLRNGGAESPSTLLAEFSEAGRASIENLARSIDQDKLRRAVTVLAGARTIHIVGLRRTFAVASYLAYAFEKMSIPAILHAGVRQQGIERLGLFLKGPLVLLLGRGQVARSLVHLGHHHKELNVRLGLVAQRERIVGACRRRGRRLHG